MNILITGSAGMLGGNLLKQVLNHTKHKVIALYSQNKPQIIEHPRLTLLPFHPTMGIKYNGEVDYIVHCAWDQVLELNDMLACCISKFAKEKMIAGLINISSLDVYGDVSCDVINEMTPLNPSTPYGRKKLDVEKFFSTQHTDYPTISLRPCGILGKGAKGVWISSLVSKAICGDDIVIYNPQEPFNNICHVDDIFEIVKRVVSDPAPVSNSIPLGSSNPESVADIVNRIVDYLQSSSKIIICEDRKHSFTISSQQVINASGHTPRPASENLIKYLNER